MFTFVRCGNYVSERVKVSGSRERENLEAGVNDSRSRLGYGYKDER